MEGKNGKKSQHESGVLHKENMSYKLGRSGKSREIKLGFIQGSITPAWGW